MENGISNMSYFPHDADDQQIMFIADCNRIENPAILSGNSEMDNENLDDEMNPVLLFYKEKQ